ncbi:MAG TPA: phosphoenolpyruvate carboxylase [Steroidobacteraceae bacterium]|nr:phosphoenolpyruvate carboxylase [Steroidobacteraceae bacterium]
MPPSPPTRVESRANVHRDQIKFPPKHLALREDVHQLGALVGDILREQGGDALFDLVEGDRTAAIRRREGQPGADAELMLRVQGRPPAIARDLVRAFSTWFQTVNLAERVHRIRRRREYFLADSTRPQPSGVEDALAALKAQGFQLDAVLDLLAGLRIEPVLIAHPTESARRTQLRRQQRMAGTLLDRLNPNLDPHEIRHLWARMRTEITTGWQTEEHPRQRLTVADEREHAIFHFAEVLYRIVPAFYEEIATALEKLYGASVAGLEPPSILRFGTWVGGDMEGTPDVHAKSIRDTLARQQQVIINSYHRECQELAQLLSQSASRVAISPQLARRIDEYMVLLPGAQSIAPARHDRMPYRVFLGQVSERLKHTYEGRSNRYEKPAQFRADLELIAASLLANRGVHAGYQLVRRLSMRVNTFGFHLATLDLRQHADVHHAVLAQGLDDPQWTRRSAAERHSKLVQVLERDAGPRADLDALGKRTLTVFDAALQGRHRYGDDAVGYYVVSGAAGADDLLAPLVLARWAGAYDRRTGQVGLDIAPQFESVPNLNRCGDVMREVLADPVYRRHLDARSRRQCVVVGYSHGSRESGFIAARLAVYDAQRALTAALFSADEKPVVFHARGGSVVRGGSRIDAILKAAPPETVNGVLRLTEQGETISQSYGLRPNAMRTLERAFSALSLATAANQQHKAVPESQAQHDCAATVAAESLATWRRFVIDDREFYDFFRAVTPIDVIERMQIGSRSVWEAGPAQSAVLSVRSTPWVFAWSQARYMIPGWYGAGAGLAAGVAQHGLPLLRACYREWPFFTTVIDDIETMLARTDLTIAQYYDTLASAPLQRFAAPLRSEFAQTCELVLQIKDAAELLDTDRTLQRAIQLRNPYVDPMNLMQVDLLRRWRATGRDDQDLFQALLASVSGIAQGLQTTG